MIFIKFNGLWYLLCLLDRLMKARVLGISRMK